MKDVESLAEGVSKFEAQLQEVIKLGAAPTVIYAYVTELRDFLDRWLESVNP